MTVGGEEGGVAPPPPPPRAPPPALARAGGAPDGQMSTLAAEESRPADLCLGHGSFQGPAWASLAQGRWCGGTCVFRQT